MLPHPTLARRRSVANKASEWAASVKNPDGIGWWLAEGVRELEAERDRVQEALAGLDGPIRWLSEHYPAAFDAMPVDLFRRIADAGAALSEPLGSGLMTPDRRAELRVLFIVERRYEKGHLDGDFELENAVRDLIASTSSQPHTIPTSAQDEAGPGDDDA